MESQVRELLAEADSIVSHWVLEGGGTTNIDQAIDIDRRALDLCPSNHPLRFIVLVLIAAHLSTRYELYGGISDLNETIILARDALLNCPPGHPDLSASLSNLAFYLWTRYNELGGIEDLNEAIALTRKALARRHPGHLDRPATLNNLASYLHTQYEYSGRMDDLYEAISLARDALSICPPGHQDRALSLGTLASSLCTLYGQLGGINTLNEAIDLSREALSLRPPGHPARSGSLNNIAHYLSIRYEQLGRIDDLNEAIVFAQDALSLFPLGHSQRSTALSNVSSHLCTRYKALENVRDLTRAIEFTRDALALRPPGHPQRLTSLNNLASYLTTRYESFGDISDLDEAIVLARDAVSLCAPGNPLRSNALDNISNYFHIRYKKLEEISDLDEAITLAGEALSVCPPSRPDRPILLNKTALYLCIRYARLKGVDDLNEAIILCQDALALHHPGHPGRSTSLESLAECLYLRFKRLGRAEDKQTLFGLYAELEHASKVASSSDLSASKAWVNVAEELHHPTTILAYETTLRLVVEHLASLPSLLPQYLTSLKAPTSFLAADAFSACLRSQSPTRAVELLERGRGVCWSYLTRLCSPLEDVIASDSAGKALADEFTRLTSLISTALQSPGADQHDQLRSLDAEIDDVVSKIRALPGFSRFLLPPVFSDLRMAARDGPVIIVNASNYTCDALVVFADKDPVHISLSVTREDAREWSSRFRALTESSNTKRPMDEEVEKSFMAFLRELWDGVVSYIIDVLQTTCPRGSRIWWCPTLEFSLLPLHAAAPYRKGKEGVSDLYISSYTTTLAALIHARRPRPPSSESERKRFIAVGQAHASGATELLSASTELSNIDHLVNHLAEFTRVEGTDACLSRVTDELQTHDWVHLACHGFSNQWLPLASGFALHDGFLTLERILQCDMPNPELAYLSACHATKGDESVDEAVHLTAAMQRAGFRSVVGTTWAVDDALTSTVASVFYACMVDEGLDYTRAAFALHKTMRMVDMPIDQRLVYIHVGA